MERLIRFSTTRVQNTSLHFTRYLYETIDWNSRLIGILGARGTGKTTLLLQRLKRTGFSAEKALYLSLDDPYFQEYSLLDSLEDFVNQGGAYLYLDEVHKYASWSSTIKTLYDTFPKLQIVFTGSSILQLERGEADLSRRARPYELAGLSFREFLNLKGEINTAPVVLDYLLAHHPKIASEITQKTTILKWFKEYVEAGYYPFFLEERDAYALKLAAVVNQVLENDILHSENLRVETVGKMKRFLAALAEMVPFQPNMLELSEKLKVSRPLLYQFLDYLERGKIIQLAFQESSGLKKLEKPDKIFLQNTNLAYALTDATPDKGNLRETFFMNQLRVQHRVEYGKDFDFKVDGVYSFEIGGKNKSPRQIKNENSGWLALDDIEVGYGNKVPLWLFGFLY
jgi:uncharacterized protein